MPLDDRAKQFLGNGPIQQVPGQVSTKAEKTLAEYQQKEYLERAGGFAEELIAFFVQQRKRHDYLDDECAGAIALFTINLRRSYGEPQNDEEQKTWTDAKRDARLQEFDAICEAMQTYHDENI